jgi:LPXTG-motif cell wall-anchored protein
MERMKNRGMAKWSVLFLAVCTYLMGFIARFAWAPVISAAVPDLGMDMTQAGLYMSAFYIGYVLVHIPAGYLADRFGARFIIVTAMIIEGLSCIGLAMTGSFAVGFALRVLTGLGAGTVYASCIRLISSWYEPHERGTAFGFLMISPALGVLVANQLTSLILGYFAWQGLFISIGIIAMLLAVIAFVGIRDKVQEVKAQSFSEGIKYVLSNKNIVMMSLIGFCLMWAQVGFISWGNTAIERAGYSVGQAVLAMTLFGVGGIAGPLVSGYMLNRSKNKKRLLMATYLVLMVLLLVFGNMQQFAVLAALTLLIGFTNGYANTFLPLLVNEYADPKWSGIAGGVSGCIYQIGAIIGPLAIGFSVDKTGSFGIAWYMLAGAALLGALLLIGLRNKSELPKDETVAA